MEQAHRRKVSNMRKQNPSDLIAIVCADLHLSHKPPAARAGEPDWYAAMKRPLQEIWNLADTHNVPVLCAGDVFDHWMAPPELINFAHQYMPKMFAVPGQHDMPHHDANGMHRSVYHTLQRMGTIETVWLEKALTDIIIYGFPWGREPELLLNTPRTSKIRIALIHKYLWTEGASIPMAPAEGHVTKHTKAFDKFEIVISGDNHKQFTIQGKGEHPTIFNCGPIMRRHADDANTRPRVGLVYSNGKVESHYLDTSEDVFAPDAKETKVDVSSEMEAYLQELRQFEKTTLDYREALRTAALQSIVDKAVRNILIGEIDGNT